MNQVGEKLFAGSRFAVYKHGRVRVGDVQGKLDRAADGRRLPDNLAVFLMKLRFQAHHFRRELVALESRADLVGDAFDKRDVVVFKRLGGFFAPDETEKSESVSADAHGRYQRGFSVKLRV